MGTVLYQKPAPLTREEKKVWLHKLHGVSLGSDAFFPFGDNIERAHRSGVSILLRQAEVSEMIMLLKHVINIISQWHLLVYVCSIINNFPPKKTLADFFEQK